MSSVAQQPAMYLVHHNGVGVIVKLINRDTSAEKFGEIQRDFATKAGAKGREYAEMVRLDLQQQAAGLFYDWELAGPDGASYRIIRWPTTSDELVEKAKAEIRHRFDVVRLSVIHIRSMADTIDLTA